MSIPIDAATARISNQISEAEAQSDRALIANARLLETMLLARQADEVDNPMIGQEAILRLVRAMQSQTEASNRLFQVHGEMRKVGVTVGIMDEDGSCGDGVFKKTALREHPEAA